MVVAFREQALANRETRYLAGDGGVVNSLIHTFVKTTVLLNFLRGYFFNAHLGML